MYPIRASAYSPACQSGRAEKRKVRPSSQGRAHVLLLPTQARSPVAAFPPAESAVNHVTFRNPLTLAAEVTGASETVLAAPPPPYTPPPPEWPGWTILQCHLLLRRQAALTFQLLHSQHRANLPGNPSGQKAKPDTPQHAYLSKALRLCPPETVGSNGQPIVTSGGPVSILSDMGFTSPVLIAISGVTPDLHG